MCPPWLEDLAASGTGYASGGGFVRFGGGDLPALAGRFGRFRNRVASASAFGFACSGGCFARIGIRNLFPSGVGFAHFENEHLHDLDIIILLWKKVPAAAMKSNASNKCTMCHYLLQC